MAELAAALTGMMLFEQIALAVLLPVLTLSVECGGVVALIRWLRTVKDIRKLPMGKASVLVMQTTMAILLLQGLVMLLWAGCYRWLCFSSWNQSFYFSASTYSTVGYGDVVLPAKWHLFGPLESIMGVLMCGISVSLLFALVTRLLESEVAGSGLEELESNTRLGREMVDHHRKPEQQHVVGRVVHGSYPAPGHHPLATDVLFPD